MKKKNYLKSLMCPINEFMKLELSSYCNRPKKLKSVPPLIVLQHIYACNRISFVPKKGLNFIEENSFLSKPWKWNVFTLLLIFNKNLKLGLVIWFENIWPGSIQMSKESFFTSNAMLKKLIDCPSWSKFFMVIGFSFNFLYFMLSCYIDSLIFIEPWYAGRKYKWG